MTLSLPLPINTIINLPRPLLLGPPSRCRFSTVAFRPSSLLHISGVVSRNLCRYWFSTMTTAARVEQEEDKQSKTSVELKEKIEITEKEREIFDRLLGTLRFCNLDTQLRVAGGWVRDKVRTLEHSRR